MTKEELKELEKQRDELDKQIKEYYNNERSNLLKEHRKLVGKCFKGNQWLNPDIIKYYKVIHEESDNEYRVETLTFREKLSYKHLHKRLHGYGYRTDCELFEFEDIMVSDLNKMEEITEEEFNTAMDNCLKELKDIIDKQIKERKELET
jgi:hypothetical protein